MTRGGKKGKKRWRNKGCSANNETLKTNLFWQTSGSGNSEMLGQKRLCENKKTSGKQAVLATMKCWEKSDSVKTRKQGQTFRQTMKRWGQCGYGKKTMVDTKMVQELHWENGRME